MHQQPAAEPCDAGIAWLRDLDRRFQFVLIIALSESALRWMCAMPMNDPLRLKAQLPSDAALDAALDRRRLAALAHELGLPVPTSRLWPCLETRTDTGTDTWTDTPANTPMRTPTLGAPPDDHESGRNPVVEAEAGARAAVFQGPAPQNHANIGYPRMLKPARSPVVIEGRKVSMAAAMVHDDKERAATLAAWLPFTAVQEQAWVPGRGLGVEVLFERGRMVWHFVHERLHEWPLTGGASTLRRAAGAETALVALTCRLLEHLQWHGVAMVEWRREVGGDTRLIEINPRLWDSLPLTLAAGVDMPLGLLKLAQGAALPTPKRRIGLVARNLTEDLHWCIAHLRADRRDPTLLTERPWRSVLGWLRPLWGREIWDGWSWHDPAIAGAELAALIRDVTRTLTRRSERRAASAQARRHHAAMKRPGGRLTYPVRSVLFLCLGNLCRSPVAAAAARARLPNVQVESAGFLYHDGRASPPHVVATARLLGLDVSTARARRVTAQQIHAANLIVCMDLSHLERIAEEFPQALAKTTLLGLFSTPEELEIADPYEMAPAATYQVFVKMLAAIDALGAQISTLRA